MNTQDLLQKCIDEVKKINSGERFLVKDLFLGYEWSRLDNGTKRTLGTIFLSWARSYDQIKIDNKTSQHQQVYEKK